jgi:malonyl CoA-acyl carrier protein transacylase
MVAELNSLLKAFRQGAEPRLRDLAYTCAVESEQKSDTSFRVSFVVRDLAELSRTLETVIKTLDGDGREALPEHIRIKDSKDLKRGSVAFLFSGQGSQYVGMCREIALYAAEMRESIETIDRELWDCFPKRLSSYIFPPSGFTEEERGKRIAELSDTHVAQPALAAIESGFITLFRRLEIRPDMAAGHSFGEYVALHSAGTLSRLDLFRLAEIRGRILKNSGSGETAGAMAAVRAEREMLRDFLKDFPDVVIANHNAPLQSVLSGPERDLRDAAERLQNQGITVHFLPVSGAFHSPLVRSAQYPLKDALASTKFVLPAIPVYSNSTAEPHQEEAKAIRKQLSDHLLQPVEFVSEIRNMYEAGARIFVEIGPGRVLSNLTKKILEGKECAVIPAEGHCGGLHGFLSALGTLFSEGVGSRISSLFDLRDVNKLDLRNLAATRPGKFSATTCFVSGGAVRYHDDRDRLSGRQPQLIKETAEMAYQAGKAEEGRPAGTDQAIAAYQETMREFLRLQEQVMQQFLTGGPLSVPAHAEREKWMPGVKDLLSEVPAEAMKTVKAEQGLERLLEKEPAMQMQGPDRSQEFGVSAGEGQWTRDEITATLLDIVSTRTGYPPEMLGLDQDIEAELGIDSIKRVEILSLLQKRLPSRLAEGLQTKMEVFTQLKALRAIVDEFVKFIPGAFHSLSSNNLTVQPLSTSEGTSRPCANSKNGSVPRFVMKAKKKPLPEGTFIKPSGLYLITQDASFVAPLLAESLKEKGASAEILGRDLLYDVAKLKDRVEELRSRFGPVAGIVHLSALQESSMPSTLAEWRRYTQLYAKGFFHLIRLCARDLSAASASLNGRVLCVSMSGGSFGRNGETRRCVPALRAGVGILNSLVVEWPGIRTKAVDLDDSTSPADMRRHIIDELLLDCNDREIGYPAGIRTVSHTVPSPLNTESDEKQLSLSDDAIILATGGARGITAEIVNELAVKGMTVILVGRSAEPAAEGDETEEIRDRETLRQFLIRRASERGDAATPAALEKQLSELMRNREIRANISRLKAKGVNVEYHAADVRSEEVFGTLIDEVYRRYRRLDVVLHGAGVIEDKWLIDKTEESFDRVFDTKADSSFILWKHVRPDSLRYFILFGSVAGRYGNAGQADYAAANETLNQLAWNLHAAWENTRVISINWGPWEGAGMASDGVVNTLSSKRGILPIPVKSGLEFFRNELRYGSRGDVEVVAGEGPWASEDASL